MAANDDQARLLVSIEATQAKFEKQLAAIAKRAGDTAGGIERNFKRANDNAASSFSSSGAKITQSLGAQKAAAQQLSFQLNDIATQLGSGTSPFRVLAQQGGQVVQALNQAGGAAGAVRAIGAAFGQILNPIGIATIAIGTLAAAAYEYFSGTEEDGEKANKTLEEHRGKIKAALEAWGTSAPQALVDYNAELDRIAEFNAKQAGLKDALDQVTQPLKDALSDIEFGVTDVQQSLIDLGQLDAARGIQDDFEALKKAIESNEDPTEEAARLLQSLGTTAEASGGVLARNLTAALESLSKKMDEVSERAGALRGNLQSLQDPARNAINSIPLPSIGGSVTSGAGVFNPSQTQIDMAEEAKRAAEQAAREAEREATQAAREAAREAARAAKEAADKLTRAITTQSAVAVDAAATLLGQNETANRGNINAFLKAGGVDLDAATTAWCAAFVNSALAQVGVAGTGSNVATSFANWGVGVDPSQVMRGDVLLDSNGAAAGQTGGHVGLATGMVRFQEGILQLQMLSGNASNSVQEDWINASDVIARRASEAMQLPAGALDHIGQSSDQAKARVQELGQQYEQFGQIASTALNGIATALADGKLEGKELLQILMQVVQQLLTMPSAGGGLLGGLLGGVGGGGLLGGMIIPGVLHSGGVAGKDGYGHGRAVSPSTFSGAKRYHTGGVAGLMPGEVPAILQRGEVVLPRGTKAGGAQGVQVQVGVAVDDEGKLQAYVKKVSQQEVAASAPRILNAANQQAPAAVSKYQASKGGAEWR